jgi:malonate-semialdehyde dehydrogenase (acetylating)/methylmalonate-semialdehyde dehydrogenase
VARLDEVKSHYGTLRNYVAGEWIASSSSERLNVLNPATGEEIAVVPMTTRREVNDVVKKAREAWWEWRETPPASRARFMFDIRNILETHFESIARIVVQENGKTIDEARGEVRRAIENVETAAAIPSLQMGYSLENGASYGIDEEAIRTPLGDFGAIVPFNFPAMVPFWFWPYAVATGNTYIVKTSEQAPCTMQFIMEILDESGLPEGVLNVVHGGRETAETLIEHPDITGISFVGSTPVARHVYARSAQFGKRVQAQGGAKNCLVVMEDASLSKAVPNMIASCYGCAGQRCLAGSNILVMDSMYEEFREEFADRAGAIRMGYELEEHVSMGPVISAKSRERIIKLIGEAVHEGGRLLLDGRKGLVKSDGFFVGPTIIENVRPEMSIMREEVFGPVVSLIRVRNLDEAIDIIDSIPYGNAASIYIASGLTARQFKYRVEAGNIGINVGVAAPVSSFPFAGRKESFFGDLHAQGGKDGIDFFTDRKVVIERWL